ncbi:unnamed protein product, partial [Meganyctiphanes norvegica]
DVTLACDRKYYRVHKLVLVMCSEYFSDIFQITHAIDPVVILTNIKCSDLEVLLEFMYNGEAHVRKNDLPSLMEAAEWLRVKGLQEPNKEPRHTGSSKSHKRLEHRSPPPKRKRTNEAEPRNVNSSLDSHDIPGSSVPFTVFQSQHQFKQIKLEKGEKVMEITKKRSSYEGTVFNQGPANANDNNSDQSPDHDSEPGSDPDFDPGSDRDFDPGSDHDLDTDNPQDLPSFIGKGNSAVIAQGPDSATDDIEGKFPTCLEFSGYHGNIMLAVGDYLFKLERRNNKRSYYRCEEYKRCPVRVNTEGGVIVKIKNPTHSHPSVPGKALVEKIMSDMMVQAATTQEEISHIVATGLNQVQRDHQHYLVGVQSLMRNLNRARHKTTAKTKDQHQRSLNKEDQLIRNADDRLVFNVIHSQISDSHPPSVDHKLDIDGNAVISIKQMIFEKNEKIGDITKKSNSLEEIIEGPEFNQGTASVVDHESDKRPDHDSDKRPDNESDKRPDYDSDKRPDHDSDKRADHDFDIVSPIDPAPVFGEGPGANIDQGTDSATGDIEQQFPTCLEFSGYHGTSMLAVGDYIFKLETQHNKRSYYRCEEYKHCPVRVNTEGGVIVKIKNAQHTHPSVPGKAQVEKIMGDMMLRAATTKEDIGHIMTTGLSQVQVDHQRYLVQHKTLRRNLNRARHNANLRAQELHNVTVILNRSEQTNPHTDDNVVNTTNDGDL